MLLLLLKINGRFGFENIIFDFVVCVLFSKWKNDDEIWFFICEKIDGFVNLYVKNGTWGLGLVFVICI